ncbi:MAG: hypothetical protein RBR71_07365 [Gudongella sp.]|nr:hypothetical protein [Gudongella sp.]
MFNKKAILRGLLLLIIINIFPIVATADVGPKPSLEIVVKGMEDNNYWLDLLVTDKSEYSWLELSYGERERVKKLAEYVDEEGFHPALLVGTQVPLNGELRGVKNPDNTNSHKFSYMGTPERFKIAILTEDNTLIISDVINRKNFNSIVEFDLRGEVLQGDIILSAGQAKEISPILNMSIGFIFRLLLTLAIEIGIALLFGFTIKNSGKILLKTNILTQVLLNIAILWMNLSYGMLAALFIFVLMEILIIIFETIIYAKYLTEKPKSRRIAYGVVANIVSLVVGFGINLVM